MQTTYDQQMAAVKHMREEMKISADRLNIDMSVTIQALDDAYTTIAAVKLVQSLEPKEKSNALEGSGVKLDN